MVTVNPNSVGIGSRGGGLEQGMNTIEVPVVAAWDKLCTHPAGPVLLAAAEAAALLDLIVAWHWERT
jgi:hypothetical protein